MFRDRLRSLASYFLFSVLSFSLFGCSSPAVKPTPTPTDLTGSGKPEQIQLSCPEEDTLFSLWFSHLAVLDIDAGDGETIHLEFENIPPSFFDLWIKSDGSITNEGIFREAPIGYHGTATHPNSDNCPVQTFDGVWQMRAKITGICRGDIANIHILEEFLNPVLNSDCTSESAPVAGTVSAPELDLVFDLKSDFPADGISIPEGGLFHASYDYHLWLAGYDLPVVPLVPESD
jgi:hypothetical protein